ncbi:hypothetical protein N0A02_21390 [Paraburkholderia acidicola]|uniref:Uncharacterized protein n=1 Tax=Paraburkholderia acidicola TaxID=1912599 RepID=A0ABV1LSR7_9BURK
MNIDFHYGVIYVVSRLAGLPVADATTVAHACQYVDDATTPGLLYFAGGERFERIASAHKIFDYENLFNELNRLVWTPFHFLPAGEGDTLEERAVCRPDSKVARDVILKAIAKKGTDNALHRLGVTLHTYVDTWAHQGFSGIESDYNKVSHLEAEDCTPAQWFEHLRRATDHLVEDVEAEVLSRTVPLGHGAALHYPDQPWAKWHYINGKGHRVVRDNLPDFLVAADMACRAVQAYCAGADDLDTQPGLKADAKSVLRELLSTNVNTDENVRLEVIHDWLAAGAFPGLKEELVAYVPKGPGSWKHKATGIKVKGDGGSMPLWTPAFEQSDYRKFHDAVKEHRFAVIQEVLPENGLRLV